MRPSPTTPTVFPEISTPVYLERFHSPPLSEDDAAAVLRATANSSATACSAAETMLEVGALTTITPLAVAAGTSTLSSPTPARATTLSSGAAATTSASTCVALRTMSAWALATAESSAGRSVPSTCRTSKSSARTSMADGARSSAMSTTGRSAGEFMRPMVGHASWPRPTSERPHSAVDSPATGGFTLVLMKNEYAEEARQRWGDTEAYKQSQQRTGSYTDEDWARIKAEADDLTARFTALKESGAPAGGPSAIA